MKMMTSKKFDEKIVIIGLGEIGFVNLKDIVNKSFKSF